MKRFLKIFLALTLITATLLASVACSAPSDESLSKPKWFYGAEKPSDNPDAIVGDLYLNYNDRNVYELTLDGWEFAFNMAGNKGKNGKDGKNASVWLHGENDPSKTDGENGDFYINTKTLTVFKKGPNSWSVVTRFTKNHFYDYENDSDGTLKILCIGNSYSVDTMHYVQRILADIGIDNVTLGNLYIGGCPIGTHYNNIINDAASYRFYYNTTGKWSQTEGYSIKQALLLEDWDFVSFQQRSGYSGKPEYYENLQPLVDEVRKIEPNATFLWNMTWAYEEGYESLSGYKNSQLAMYDAIVDTVESVIIPNGSFEFISPVGTAVQNARTSSLGDTLNRDGTHLSYSVGRYIAALTFAGAVTGRDISGVTWRPSESDSYFNSNPVSEEEQKIAIESAVNALKTPLMVTESAYK